jgi:hypothetical protein
MMDQNGVFKLPAPVRTTGDTCHDRFANLSDSFIYETRGLITAEKSHEVLDMALNHLTSEGTL